MRIRLMYLIRGVPGAGKTREANQLAPHHVFEADDYFMVDGVYRYNPEEIIEAHHHCQTRVERAMQADVSPIAVANTFTRRWEMKPYYVLAAVNGYVVQQIVLKPELTAVQLANRNVHGVSAVQIQAMIDRWED